jgi:hypothetical protein
LTSTAERNTGTAGPKASQERAGTAGDAMQQQQGSQTGGNAVLTTIVKQETARTPTANK